ncbi:MAG: endonuclease/exonuclease/phosphatase family protein [Clostridia bacterium]|nr:endonuclease/exonuclease/phosphatase family protein [Clostridia bacterium]
MKISVISFNIRCCDDINQNSIAERAPRLSAVTSRYEADIIAFQEYRPQWEPYIAEFYQTEYNMFLKYRNKTIDIEASPILWRKDKFECIKTGYFWLSDTPEVESRGWDEVYNCYRMCVYVILKDIKNGTTFTVMNTHFGFGDKGQVDSANLIYDYSKKISDLKTFIVGDFNMTPESLGYAAMTKNFRDLNTLTSNDLSTTFHNYQPETIKDQHIDYCFIDKNITPINQVLITDTVDGKYPSDHFGLHIELDI